jgi:ribonucleotide reductase alpha subunit
MRIISPELIHILKKSGIWNKSIQKQIQYSERELAAIEEIPASRKGAFSAAHMINNEAIIDEAACRQKWTDQSPSESPIGYVNFGLDDRN